MSDCKGCKYWTQAIDDYANGRHTDKEPNPFCSTCEGDKYQPRGAKETKAFLSAKIATQASEIKSLQAKVGELGTENERMRETVSKIISAYESCKDEWFCLNCGVTVATFEERCDQCGADLNFEVDGFINELKQALNGEYKVEK